MSGTLHNLYPTFVGVHSNQLSGLDNPGAVPYVDQARNLVLACHCAGVREEAAHFNNNGGCRWKQRCPRRVGIRGDEDLSRFNTDTGAWIENDPGSTLSDARRRTIPMTQFSGQIGQRLHAQVETFLRLAVAEPVVQSASFKNASFDILPVQSTGFEGTQLRPFQKEDVVYAA
jgi:hypothetical protein